MRGRELHELVFYCNGGNGSRAVERGIVSRGLRIAVGVVVR